MSSKIKKIILFGGGKELVSFVEKALPCGFELSVVSAPNHLDAIVKGDIALAGYLESQNIPVIKQAEFHPSDFRKYIDGNTIGFSISAVWIFRQDVIDMFGGRLFNLHTAPLPRARGAGGVTWQILTGDRKGGSTIHKLAAGIDAGDIVMQEIFEYPHSCRIPVDYYSYLQKVTDQLVPRFLEALKNDDPMTAVEQDESQSTYWPRINTKLHGWIDWNWSADQIERCICAFDDPYPGASTTMKGKRIHLKKCRIAGDGEVFHPLQSGLVYRVIDRKIFVASSGGGIVIEQILDEDGKDILDTVRLGWRFATPSGKLDQARMTRVLYGARGMKTVSYFNNTDICN